MAKPLKYPKKLRVKLEKMAEKREDRVAADAEAKDNERVFNTLWHEFLGKGSVHVIRARFSDDQTKIQSTYDLFAAEKAEYVYTTPPWPPSETPDPA